MKICPKRILVIYQHYDDIETMRLTHRRHMRVMEASETNHDIVYYNTADDAPTWYNQNKSTKAPEWIPDSHFDAVILHNTLLGYRFIGPFFYEWKRHFNWIRDLDCLKIAIPQDEYDCPGILDEWLFDWGVSVVFSINGVESEILYPIMHTKAAFYECLPGYVDEPYAKKYAGKLLPVTERPYDIVYRASNLPYYFGSFSQLKHHIAEIIAPCAQAHGLKCDISTSFDDVILGSLWLDFLASGKAVIGCEGGASATDWRGEMKAIEEAMRKENPDLTFDEFKANIQPGWDDYRFVSITPRQFECVITKTCLVLVEGDYNGILESDRHYIPIKTDFSNLDGALEKLNDTEYIQNMVDRVYQDIYLNGKYNYRSFAGLIEKAILDHEQHSLHIQTGESREMTEEPDKMSEIIERQLLALRHENMRLEANMHHVMMESGINLGQRDEALARCEMLIKELQEEQKRTTLLRRKLMLLMFATILLAAGMVVSLSIALIFS